MDVEETEAKNDCAGEGQQQFNRPTDQSQVGVGGWQTVLSCIVSSRYLATTRETK
jgi:hypothetical protein